MFSKTRIQVGDPAPDFTLNSQSGQEVSLRDFHGLRNVVLYFYPKDDSPICTKEACTFRDSYEGLQASGAEVIGISADSAESHQQFASKYKLPFTLLSDPTNQVRKSYGVKETLGFIPGRVTFLIDKEGIIRHIFDAQLSAKAHVEEALRNLQDLYIKCPYCRTEVSYLKYKVVEDDTCGFVHSQTSANVIFCPHCHSVLGVKMN